MTRQLTDFTGLTPKRRTVINYADPAKAIKAAKGRWYRQRSLWSKELKRCQFRMVRLVNLTANLAAHIQRCEAALADADRRYSRQQDMANW